MAIKAGQKSGLMTSSYNPVRNIGVDSEAQEFADKQLRDLKNYEDKLSWPGHYPYEMNSSGPDSTIDWKNGLNEKYKRNLVSRPNESIGVNNAQMGFSMPYRGTFLNNMPYTKDEYMAEFRHGMSSNDDDATNRRYQELAMRKDELEQTIMDLEAEIAYQKQLRKYSMANDPEWNVAKHDWIYRGDRSGIDQIRSRMEADKQRAWQASENKKQRMSSEKLAATAKASADEDQKKANREVLNSKRKYLTMLFSEKFKENSSDSRMAIFEAAMSYADAAAKAGESPDKVFDMLEEQYGEGARKLLGRPSNVAGASQTSTSVATPDGNGADEDFGDIPNFKDKPELDTFVNSTNSTDKLEKAVKKAVNAGLLTGDEAANYLKMATDKKREVAKTDFKNAKNSKQMGEVIEQYNDLMDDNTMREWKAAQKAKVKEEAKYAKDKLEFETRQNELWEKHGKKTVREFEDWIKDHPAGSKEVEKYIIVEGNTLKKKKFTGVK